MTLPDTLDWPATVPLQVRRAYAAMQPLYSSQQVEHAVDQLAVRLTVALQQADPVIVTVLHGGLALSGMLQRRLAFACQFGYVQVASYGAHTSPGELNWGGFDVPDLNNRTVLLVDDILDRGQTLAALKTWAAEQGATDVQAAVLIQREDPQRQQLAGAEYFALQAGPGFLLGCGMDIAGYGRNLSAIYQLPEDFVL